VILDSIKIKCGSFFVPVDKIHAEIAIEHRGGRSFPETTAEFYQTVYDLLMAGF
jgi:hypothetical protein